MTPKALDRWIAHYNEVETAIPTKWIESKDIASKAGDNVARIAAIFEILESGSIDGTKVVSERAMERAVAIGKWFQQETVRSLDQSEIDENIGLAERLGRKLVEYCEENNSTAVPRRIYRHFLRAFRGTGGTSRLEETELLLEAAGHGARRQRGRAKVFEVNPKTSFSTPSTVTPLVENGGKTLETIEDKVVSLSDNNCHHLNEAVPTVDEVVSFEKSGADLRIPKDSSPLDTSDHINGVTGVTVDGVENGKNENEAEGVSKTLHTSRESNFDGFDGGSCSTCPKSCPDTDLGKCLDPHKKEFMSCYHGQELNGDDNPLRYASARVAEESGLQPEQVERYALQHWVKDENG